MSEVENPFPPNMYFYYDPVLGLQYTTGQCDFIVDLGRTPVTKDEVREFIKDWMYHAMRLGIGLIDSIVVKPYPKIISNVNLGFTDFNI